MNSVMKRIMIVSIITDGHVEKYCSFGNFPITKISSSMIRPIPIPERMRFVWKLLRR